MLKTILVPLDGSQLAESAVDYALKLVGKDSKIILLSVVQVPQFPIYDFYPSPAPMVPQYETGMNDALKIARDYLDRLAEHLRQETEATIIFEVEAGEPSEVIGLRAQALGVDAIVMSTHGRSGVGRLLFGSITNKVLANAGIPVFVVPNLDKQKEMRSTQESAVAANG